ncbi:MULTISPECIES: bifunctional phosphatase PAP2/diacylglycerol kinase family protein [Rhodococcus]|uniref:bifunctional phosphatase PAP2/diacylglycerol kinase family protein n=1 Tax=Rhodococcus TaxID=1827 RepID=UPI001E2881D4|nr:bifunctional phosphatase PAP2/diacylglycerol kinase family protein [Rhodococcus pyridinivorans]MCD2118223.1 phosphatase PAP2 family protein [Rhodococcus pyridinivorans]MCZ4627094.1 phosphatase PAP2 family protein [Rhodococcus pyridinivorans]MCZ4648368.1 phosphatase PAP2 family protein [Rhodococcus pyridinivorans]MDJ0481012.1 phosphatase PAP2 family protein [Rhodococcus pyridinivorans]MDV7254527.1 phosphatase PAP2 family protein [Rhodococcus pyridinivorans]
MGRNDIYGRGVIVPERYRTADRALFERSGALRASPADPLLRDLGRAANHSVLWVACAAVCATAGGHARRGAVRGLLSVAGASALTNGLLKPLLPRRRPPARTDPKFRRRTVPIPRSSSFPSGHAASAAAFATGVVLESPATGAVLAPLAAAVAYSRVHTGVHWPGDVVVGAAVGATVAWSTRRWWAVRSREPATVQVAAAAPALPGGDGMLLVVNRDAGTAEEIAARVTAALPRVRRVDLDPDGDPAEQSERLLTEYRPQAVGVCGGDGTVAAVLDVAVDARLPVAVFPGGTLNHFALDLGVVDLEETVRAVTAGQAVAVGLGQVTVTGPDGRTVRRFVNTASLGGYPDAVRLRQHWEPRIGKWPAAGLAMLAVLRTASPMPVRIDGAGRAVWLLFVGNGRYTPADQVPMSRAHLDPGTLDVRYLPAESRFSRLRLLLAAATGTLGASPMYRQRHSPGLTVEVIGDPVALATDGEVLADGTGFAFEVVPSALTVYRLAVDQPASGPDSVSEPVAVSDPEAVSDPDSGASDGAA